MKLQEFIKETILNIRNAVDEHNSKSNYKAAYPTQIEFDLVVEFDREEIYIVNLINENHNYSRLKFAYKMNYFPWVEINK